MTTQAFARYATQQVPRYTSYPTAPHFSDEVDSEVYSAWLSAIAPAEKVSLYLHVPFCRKVCWYCGCNMKLASRPEPVRDYATTLVQEIDLVGEKLPGRMTLSHLHWGGGTPTTLDPDDFTAVMDRVRVVFDVSADAELAVESDPRTLTAEMAERIGDLGFTRASFGVQEFDPRVQAAINRIQPPKMVRQAVDRLRGAGVDAINFDLVYGLPHQSSETLLATVATCVEMEPDRIALFGYAHVPWMAKKQRMIDEAALPGADARLDQAKRAAEALAKAGYVAIGLDHFALPDDSLSVAAKAGTMRRNFQGYTTDSAETLLGVGATSISRTPAGYAQNVVESGAWSRTVQSGRLPVGKGRAFRGEDKLRGRIIEALMCRGEADLHGTAQELGASERWYAAVAGALTDLTRDGLVEFVGGKLRLTDAGRPYVRVVAATFDEYLAARPGRHAVAV